MTEGSSPLGLPLPRREDERLLRGLGRFRNDVRVAGCLHAAFVRSPHGRARISAIESRPAPAMAGVRAVLTGKPGSSAIRWRWRG